LAVIKISSDGVDDILVPDEVVATDELVRQALAPYYAELANADVTRSEENGQIIVTVTKRAGTKGNDTSGVISALRAAPEQMNAALVLHHELTGAKERGELTLQKLLRLQQKIRDAVDEGTRQINEVEASKKLLKEGLPVPGRSILARY